MNTTLTKIVICGVLFLLTLISGAVLSHTPGSWRGLVFTAHKLIALAAIVMLGLSLVQRVQGLDMHLFSLALIAVTGFFCLALVVTGGLLSLGKPMPELVLRLHQLLPLPALISSAAGVFLLAPGRA